MNVEKTNHDFGWALGVIKDGGKVRRAKWKESRYLILVDKGTANHPLVSDGKEVEALPSIGLRMLNHDGTPALLNGWLASQCDMLAEDWQLVV